MCDMSAARTNRKLSHRPDDPAPITASGHFTMAAWAGSYIAVSGLADLYKMSDTTTTGGFSIVGPYEADSGSDDRLYPGTGDTIDGSEVVGLFSMGSTGDRFITIDGVTYDVEFGFLGFELANGTLLINPNVGSANEDILQALHDGGVIEAVTIGTVTTSAWNGVPDYYSIPAPAPGADRFPATPVADPLAHRRAHVRPGRGAAGGAGAAGLAGHRPNLPAAAGFLCPYPSGHP